MPDNSVDSIVCDPPYGLEFMGQEFDSADGFRRSLNDADAGRDTVFGRASRTSPEYKVTALFQEFTEKWATEALRVLKPGGHMLAFGGARTYHRLVCAIEDAGFEIRDQIMWIYGSGFPKSLDVSKAIDKMAGAEREIIAPPPYTRGKATQSYSETRKVSYDCEPQPITAPSTDKAKEWTGWGTSLKPAHEPVVVARKPLIGTVAVNVLTHGTGAINIDASRVGDDQVPVNRLEKWSGFGQLERPAYVASFNTGRWPANIIHDGSDEVLEHFPEASGAKAPVKGTEPSSSTKNVYNARKRVASNTREGELSADRRYTENGVTNFAALPGERRFDSGSAARFFYCAKPSSKERHYGMENPGVQFSHGDTLRKIENTEKKGNFHPTVKPIALMAYLVRLVTPPGGLVVDPFVGSGTTGIAAIQGDFDFLGIEQDPKYLVIAKGRIMAAVLEKGGAEVLSDISTEA